MLLKTADVSSRRRRCCIQATPPEQHIISYVSHSEWATDTVQYVVIFGAHTLTRCFCLLVSTLKAELCTNLGFRCASSHRWTDFVCNDIPRRSDGVTTTWLLSSVWMWSVMFRDNFPCELKHKLPLLKPSDMSLLSVMCNGNSFCAHCLKGFPQWVLHKCSIL